MSGNYLVHYGVKGQRRGVRRWTNADGSLNAAGKDRYYEDSNGNGYKPNKFVDERSNYTPTRHYMQYMSDHGGTSGRINPPKYSGFSEKDKGRNNRNEASRRENSDKYGEDARTGLSLHMDRRLEAPFRTNSRIRMSYNKDSGTYKIDNSVASRLRENKERQTARTATLQAPGSDRMERANIADKKGPYMSDEYRRELEYNSQKNQYPTKQPGTNDTASAVNNRSEKTDKKKVANDYDWWENVATEKQKQQIFNNSDRAYNQKAYEEYKDRPSQAWRYNPSKDISSNHKGGYYSIHNENDKSFHPYGEKSDGHGNETPASSSQNNPARYGKNDTASTANKNKGTHTASSSTTVTDASKSSSTQKGMNWIKKIFGKK